LTSDDTGITRLVYDAALMLQERLEGLLPTFTVHLAERIERARITNAEQRSLIEADRAKREKEEAEAKRFEQQVCVCGLMKCRCLSLSGSWIYFVLLVQLV
jgi:hypothetical protein